MSNIEFKPAEKLEVQLSRPDSSLSWGFRLQGGIDFSTPLSIQSVNPNSVSEACGLKPGDAILAINGRTSDAMMHDDAKEEIMRSGNHIIMLVQRGAVKIWKPQVTPLNELRPQELRTITTATGEDITPVQKTSLALNKPPDGPCTIGSSHNRSAQPFGKPKAAVPNVVHAQYNSPMGLYSANNIADTFAKQTVGIQSQMADMDINDAPVGTLYSGSGQILEQEVPVSPTSQSGIPSRTEPDSSDTVGMRANPVTTTSDVNNESAPAPANKLFTPSSYRPPPQNQHFTSYTPSSTPNSYNSDYRSGGGGGSNKDDDEEEEPTPIFQSRTFKKVQQELEAEEEFNNYNNNNNNNNINSNSNSNNGVGGDSSNPSIRGFRSVSAPTAKPPSERPQQQSMRCGGCDMLATGVIVKANGVPYHVACFKCESCSMNLKQKGFFLVEGKLYCETHAKRHAKPPAPGMVPVASYR